MQPTSLTDGAAETLAAAAILSSLHQPCDASRPSPLGNDAGSPAAAGMPASQLAEPPLIVVRATSGWRAIDVRELWHYHELLYFLTWRDIKVRYKQTVLGAAWAILQPVMTMLVFTIFFGRLGGLDKNKHVSASYPIFIYAALLPWQFFATSLQQGGQSLVGSANLISKVYFPRLIVPIASIGAALVDLAISFVVMLVLMIAYRVPFTENMLLLPLFFFGTLITALGATAWLSAATVSFRDFRHVLPFLIQIWMFASPVAYPFEVVPDRWQLLYALNPLAGLISGFRSALLNEPFLWGPIGVSCLSGTAMLIVGTLYFRRVERRFADII